MAAAASRFQLRTPFCFEKLGGCGHSFMECMQAGGMGPKVIDFLFPGLRDRNRPSRIGNLAESGKAVSNTNNAAGG